MKGLPSHHVLQGSLVAVEHDALLCTVVGPGLAIAVCRNRGGGGGLLHVAYRWLSPEVRRPEINRSWRRFLRALGVARTQGALLHAFGFADMMGFTSRQQMGERSAALQRLVEELADGAGMRVATLQLGGTFGRALEVDLRDGSVQVKEIRRANAGGRVSPAVVSEHTSVPFAGARERRLTPAPGVAVASAQTSVPMGEYRIGCRSDTLAVVLGSCVGVALYDPVERIGGLAHVVMPRAPAQGLGKQEGARFADTAVSVLIQALEAGGADRGRLEAKLVGGASILFSSRRSGPVVAKENVRVARATLAEAGIAIRDEDVGGQLGRKVLFELSDFRMRVKLLTDFGREA